MLSNNPVLHALEEVARNVNALDGAIAAISRYTQSEVIFWVIDGLVLTSFRISSGIDKSFPVPYLINIARKDPYCLKLAASNARYHDTASTIHMEDPAHREHIEYMVKHTGMRQRLLLAAPVLPRLKIGWAMHRPSKPFSQADKDKLNAIYREVEILLLRVLAAEVNRFSDPARISQPTVAERLQIATPIEDYRKALKRAASALALWKRGAYSERKAAYTLGIALEIAGRRFEGSDLVKFDLVKALCDMWAGHSKRADEAFKRLRVSAEQFIPLNASMWTTRCLVECAEARKHLQRALRRGRDYGDALGGSRRRQKLRDQSMMRYLAHERRAWDCARNAKDEALVTRVGNLYTDALDSLNHGDVVDSVLSSYSPTVSEAPTEAELDDLFWLCVEK